jgi:Zn-dependent protease with chaperone function
MAMNFFESQETARRNTGRLVFFFVMGIFSIIAMTYGLIMALFYAAAVESESAFGIENWWNPELLCGTVIGVCMIVGGGYVYKLSALRQGGVSVAQAMGGKLLHRDTTEFHEKKILNVVEEMAIASGVPTPPVYLMEHEEGVNAFAAGYSPKDAVIGVTRGCVEDLSREELQGVIAHEFSHILNGDMRLNIRLIAVLNGIMVMGIMGYYILRVTANGSSRRRSRDNNGSGAIALFGLGLMAIGYLGSFCGNLIKMAVSRQREFLADASAVQFTRNPHGLAGALKSIGRGSYGSLMSSPNASEISHMFFADGVRESLFTQLTATHPPLKERIKRIVPDWDGDWGQDSPAHGLEHATQDGGDNEDARRQAALAVGTAAAVMSAAHQAPPTAVESIGDLTPQHIRYAEHLIQQLPENLHEAAYDAYSARAVIFALLINVEEDVRQQQLARLAEHADQAVYGLTITLLDAIPEMDECAKLPLVDICMAALKTMSQEQYLVFRENVDFLIEVDDEIDLFEWALRRIIKTNLEAVYVNARPPRVHYYNLKAVAGSCSMLLSSVARIGCYEEKEVEKAFSAGVPYLQTDGIGLLSYDECSLDGLEAALDQLVMCAPKLKKAIIHASAAIIADDQNVTTHEAEILRAISETLDCPMPPLLPGQPLV